MINFLDLMFLIPIILAVIGVTLWFIFNLIKDMYRSVQYWIRHREWKELTGFGFLWYVLLALFYMMVIRENIK